MYLTFASVMKFKSLRRVESSCRSSGERSPVSWKWSASSGFGVPANSLLGSAAGPGGKCEMTFPGHLE